ncbi:hypothetical protein [Actinomyces wuliandei]|uniref:hypothetical protein n=1 Tax=Actinomyces wuliandei TaxID=2057743 RepID=UPI00111A8EE6|nr:hypothetical protein [Actinomyces wuliandei]
MRIVSGAGLEPQYHLGRLRRLPATLDVTQHAYDELPAMAVKPSGALWTAPATHDDDQGVATAWSDHYQQTELASTRADRLSPGYRLAHPLRQLRVVPAPQARVLVLDSLDDAVTAQQAWPAEHGRLSFPAVAADGVDAVWVRPGALTDTWDNLRDPHRPHAGVRAQLYGWDVESVAWLTTTHLTTGSRRRVRPAPENPLVAELRQRGLLEPAPRRRRGGRR